MEEVEVFTAPGEDQQKKFMELGEAGFAADQEAPPNKRAHIPKHHSKLIKICHLSSLPDIHRKPHHQTPGFFRSRPSSVRMEIWRGAIDRKFPLKLATTSSEKQKENHD
jgi:hypothetical protein